MALHVYDGDRYWIAVDMSEAREMAAEAIAALRDCCDPEWPASVESVAVYDAPLDTEAPDEGRCVLFATPVDAGPAPEGSGFERWTDYVMREPQRKEGGGADQE